MKYAEKNGTQVNNNEKYVINDGGTIFFKPEFNFQRLEAGRYYPLNDNNKFILVKVRRGISGEIINLTEKLQSTLFLKSEMDDIRNIHRIADEMDKSESENYFEDYFPLEDYNQSLNSIRESVYSFIKSMGEISSKRGILIAGDHGEGKTYMVNKLVDELIYKHDAVTFKIDRKVHLESLIQYGLTPVARYLENRLKVIVIEEMVEISDMLMDKTLFLTLLDSDILRKNVLFLITTNHPEKIPVNIVDRPSRVDDIIIVDRKDFRPEYVYDWYEFMMGEPFPEEEKGTEWVHNAISDLSPAYFKELFNQTIQYDISLKEAYYKLKERRRMIKSRFDESNIGFS